MAGTLFFHGSGTSQDLYVSALTSAYRNGLRLHDPSYPLERDPEIQQKMMRDPSIINAVEQRLATVVSRNWLINPQTDSKVDTQVSKIAGEILKLLPNFMMARRELAMSAIWGRSMQYIEGERRKISVAGGPIMDWWVPTRLKDVNRGRWRYRPVHIEGADGTQRVKQVLELFSIDRFTWEQIIDINQWIIMTYNDTEDRLGYGFGLEEAIYFYFRAKTVAEEYNLQGLERWAHGIVVAKIDSLRQASPDRSSEQVRDDWLKVLDEMRRNHVLAFDKADEIQVIESNGSGNAMVNDTITRLERGITQVLLGAVLPTGGGPSDVGSFGRAETEKSSSEDRLTFDREFLDETITDQLVSQIIRLNHQNLSALGLEAYGPLKFSSFAEKRLDRLREVQIVVQARAGGITLKRDEVYENIGYTKPAEGDDVLEPQAPAATPSPGGIPGF